ncbi:CPBP family intramembrane metalloprotease [Sutcliffiella horikoshii]|uniref:CPBP family intramembrane metalloprotease n=1 Tax=Sutcliffiella horikoshii TaxID=79883 RepID=A0A5D4T6G9_9BACI|nr:CPBP family intramembrane glutamic endopeptidase [Sutcliffiella horikoshii]TYS70501.1 CPBP family intramembrane metalloprotease [Sutcliffiella horikoshii]
MKAELNANRLTSLTISLVKFSLFLFIFIIGFFLSAIKLPDHLIIIADSLPEGTINFKLQNRILLIIFMGILLLAFGKRYFHFFSITPLKKKETYFWIIGLLMTIILLQQQPLSLYILPLSVIEYVQLFFILCIVVPIEEELLYRGLLILVPSPKFRYVTLLISSLLFAFIHASFFSSLLVGLALGILSIRFRNILVPIVAHSIWNTFSVFF